MLSWLITLTSPNDSGKVLTYGGPDTQNPLTLIIFGKPIKKKSRKKRRTHLYCFYFKYQSIQNSCAYTYRYFSMKIYLLLIYLKHTTYYKFKLLYVHVWFLGYLHQLQIWLYSLFPLIVICRVWGMIPIFKTMADFKYSKNLSLCMSLCMIISYFRKGI